MIEELVTRVFALRNATHLAHWASKSFSEHKALGKFYDGLIDKIDAIVEAHQGWNGLIGEVRPAVFPKGDITAKIREELTWINANRSKIARGNTMMENLVDDLMQLYSTTHYMLVNLK
jgi:DNA-binding ferritin-like protein